MHCQHVRDHRQHEQDEKWQVHDVPQRKQALVDLQRGKPAHAREMPRGIAPRIVV